MAPPFVMKSAIFLALTLILAATGTATAKERPRVSDDRDLKELNLAAWDCLNRLTGTAKTPDGMERNPLKNRSAPEGPITPAGSFDVPGLLHHIEAFEGPTKSRKRLEIAPQHTQMLGSLEKEIVTLTGYLNLAYAGPPETCNCGSSDYHDWHLEIGEKPIEHAPGPGDPTPIICEITPRTQNAIYHDGIRIQELTAFFRGTPPEMAYQSTGHKAQKVRITGYLLWDDEHNGTADVGTTIEAVGANKLHHPWRRAAWEIHPVLKMERAESTGNFPPVQSSAPASESPAAAGAPAESVPLPATPTATPSPTPSVTPTQMITIQIPLRIPTPQGEAVIPRGTRLPIVSRDAQTVTVQYQGQNVIIANGYTNSP
jgi:hypothetical protein